MRVGAPFRGCVHWLLHNLPVDSKRVYVLDYDYSNSAFIVETTIRPPPLCRVLFQTFDREYIVILSSTSFFLSFPVSDV